MKKTPSQASKGITHSFAERFPELAREWHPTKNGDLKPEDVSSSYKDKVWWYLPYDDEKTGHHDFEWRDTVHGRTMKHRGCPFLTGKRVWPGFNDLETRYPELAREWHPTKNGDLKPSQVVPGCNDEVWWYLPYDDEKTGHHDFEWQARISSRVYSHAGCPFLGGAGVWPGFNDIMTTHPDIAAEWDYEKNDRLPTEVSAGCGDKVWWKRIEIDDLTGQPREVSWQQKVNKRTAGHSNKKVVSKVAKQLNDLATTHPDLAAQWHPKNRKKPSEFRADDKTRVWWKWNYHDDRTGKDFVFEWPQSIRERAIENKPCPAFTGRLLVRGFNDLQTTHPDLARQWHPTKNGNLKPADVTAHSSKYVWWFYPYDDPKTGRRVDFEWRRTVHNRAIQGAACPFPQGAYYKGFNDVRTVAPELVSEWSDRNEKKPEDVLATDKHKYWWHMKYTNPKTGETRDLEWRQSPFARIIQKHGCTYLSGTEVLPGFNDLATTRPDIAKYWSPNNTRKPTEVTAGSNKRALWLLPYDDPQTGHHDFEWPAYIVTMCTHFACPYLSGDAVWPGYNDLESQYPEVAAEWNYALNHGILPSQVHMHAEKKYWWKCPKGHEYRMRVRSRTYDGTRCQECEKIRRRNRGL